MLGTELPERIGYLIFRHLQNSLDSAEKQELESWIAQSEENRLEFQRYIDREGLQASFVEYRNAKERSWNRLITNAPELAPAPVYRMNWRKAVAAAAILIVAGTGMYYWLSPGNKKVSVDDSFAVGHIKDILPGTNKATLTLSNGKTIILDSTGNGLVAQQGGVQILKQSGQLSYNDGSAAMNETLYNTITTPRGGQYPSLKLADGSEVWLNSSSSIRFPVSFTGNNRTVEITGEAWFKVVHNAKQPFKVKVNGIEINDLGTEFNVNAYEDEAIVKTTLIEGSIKVANETTSSLIKPGQQALLNKEGEIKLASDIDMDKILAWKNGRFMFKNDDIKTIMRQVSRWYDVDIQYKEPVNELFYGEISRNTKASSVFELLEATGAVHFVIEGKKIIVTK